MTYVPQPVVSIPLGDVMALVEVHLKTIMLKSLEMQEQIPKPAQRFCNDGYTRPAVIVNMHLNEIRRILHTAGL